MKLKFPRISRRITENYHKLINKPKVKKIVLIFLSVLSLLTIFILILAIFIISVKTYKNANLLNSEFVKRQKIQSQINFWNSVLEKYPDYKDVYFKIAVLEYKLGSFKNANEFNKKALLLDPSDINSINLDKLLNQN